MASVKLKKPTKVGRYTHDAATTEVARAIGRGGRGTHAALARAMRLTSQQLSHRLGGVYARFDVVDYGLAADFFADTQGPEGYQRGWPLMTYEESMAHWVKGKG